MSNKHETRLYSSISDFFRSVNLPIDQSLDFTIHRLEGLHGRVPFYSPQFRTNYFAFLLITGGNSEYTIDAKKFQLGEGSYYFTTPGHTKSFSIFEELSGFMVTFSSQFLKANYPGSAELDFPYLFDETVPVMKLETAFLQRIVLQFDQILNEYQNSSMYKERILGTQLVSLLFQTRELIVSHGVKLLTGNRPAEITRNFRIALNRHFQSVFAGEVKEIWSVKEFASILAIHPNHLSNTIKKETGKTVGEWIDEKILTEAVRLLKTTELSIAEIAWKLTFSDPSNFTRFIKRQTGKSPGEWRTGD